MNVYIFLWIVLSIVVFIVHVRFVMKDKDDNDKIGAIFKGIFAAVFLGGLLTFLLYGMFKSGDSSISGPNFTRP